MTPIVVEGHFVSPTQIELSQPVAMPEGAVEIEIRPRHAPSRKAMIEFFEALAARPARGRSKEDIDRQIQEERDSWESRR